MDYEKEYKSLVAKVKKAHLFAQTDSTKKVLEDILPQLRESEDEQIVNWLYDMLKHGIEDAPKGCPDNPIAEKALAWLEKQKELFESGKGMYYYDGEKTTYCGYPATEENPYDFAMNQQEKQKEPFTQMTKCARHFAQWGRDNLK